MGKILNSGFRPTGIFPYDPQQSFSKLLEIPSEASVTSILSDSVMEFLLSLSENVSKTLYLARKLTVKKLETGTPRKMKIVTNRI